MNILLTYATKYIGVNLCMKIKKKGNNKKYIITVILTLLFIVAAAITPRAIRFSLPLVAATPVKAETLIDTLSCTGTLEGKSSKNLYTASGIMVDEIYVKNGQQVNAGDPLFSVDKEVTVSLWVSAAEKEEANENQVSELLDGLLSDYFSASVGNIFSSFADKEQSNDKTSFTDELLVVIPDIITASTSGIIANLNIKEQTYADPSAPLLQICDTSSVFVRCELSEVFASDLTEGLKCKVSGDAFQEVYTASVAEIAPTAKAVSGGRSTVECIVEIDFPDSSLKTGYTAEVEIELSKKNGALALPYSAVFQDENGQYVWELYGSRTYRRDITTGSELPEKIEILSGIEAGRCIVTSADRTLKEGKLVTIKEQAINR